MTSEQMMEVILEEAGWRRCECQLTSRWMRPMNNHCEPMPLLTLDFMHEAENDQLRPCPQGRRGDPVLWAAYLHQLIPTCSTQHYYDGACATKEQRAEAWIKTVCPNRWTE